MAAIEWSVGDEVRKMRKEAHMEQLELALEVGVSRPLVSKWENGKSEPNVSQFRKIEAVTEQRKRRSTCMDELPLQYAAVA